MDSALENQLAKKTEHQGRIMLVPKKYQFEIHMENLCMLSLRHSHGEYLVNKGVQCV